MVAIVLSSESGAMFDGTIEVGRRMDVVDHDESTVGDKLGDGDERGLESVGRPPLLGPQVAEVVEGQAIGVDADLARSGISCLNLVAPSVAATQRRAT
jgi:hypothetical protein